MTDADDDARCQHCLQPHRSGGTDIYATCAACLAAGHVAATNPTMQLWNPWGLTYCPACRAEIKAKFGATT